MVQLRPRCAPASASVVVDEGQPALEEAAEYGLLLGQPSSGAADEPLQEDEDGDDEAPEELTFASAQAEAREEEQRVRESVRRDKTLLKEKRKRREELFIEQKKRKLLPDTILEKLTTASQTDIKKSPGKLKEVSLQKKNEECEKGSNSKKAQVQKVQSVGQNKSYLALRLKDQDLRDARQQAAKAFVQNSLYGPGTSRTTGTQKKQDAKRFKRRWMVRKMKTSKK
ncbi:hypothetical protein MC885_018660 [Smutsia gigantea]|nr:hypothetical protein MC885_018660 [Smutsia gigantea]